MFLSEPDAHGFYLKSQNLIDFGYDLFFLFNSPDQLKKLRIF